MPQKVVRPRSQGSVMLPLNKSCRQDQVFKVRGVELCKYFIRQFKSTIQDDIKVKEFLKECLRWLSAICLVLILTMQIYLFYADASEDRKKATGPIAAGLVYDPQKRHEIWRFLTYMLVHKTAPQLFVNILVEIVLGIFLWMDHQFWHVGIVFLAGGLAGSITTSIFLPTATLSGASAGLYALATAHIATLILNWSETQYACLRLVLFVSQFNYDTTTAINTSHEHTGYAANLGVQAQVCWLD